MQKSYCKLLVSLPLARAGLTSALVIILLGATVPRLAAQSYDFNAGNDTGWTHYNVSAFLGGPIPPGYPVDGITFTNGYDATPSFTFPSDGAGGYHYRIQSPAISYDYWYLTPDYPTYGVGAGPSRAASYPTTTYATQFKVGVDLVAWNASWDEYFGMIMIAQNIGLGTSEGYSGLYGINNRNIYLSTITGEFPTTIGQLADGSVPLNPTHQYRLEASSHDGFTFLLQLFDKTQPTNSPWASAIGDGGTYFASPGVCGLLTYNYDQPPPDENPGNTTQGTDATFDNYSASEPATGQSPSLWPATVTDLSPPPGGTSTAFYPANTVGILNRETTVIASSIVLYLDGTLIPNGSLTIDPNFVYKPNNPGGSTSQFDGATVSYPTATLYPSGSHHTNAVVWSDSGGNTFSNAWTWTTDYPYLRATNSLPIGSLTVRGFDARMVQSTNGGVTLANSLERALQQLAIPPQIPIDQTATSIVQVLNWDKTAAPPNNVPGLCPGGAINIAVESLAYLELTAGIHRFHINSDDRAGLYSGVNLADPNATVLWENPGSTANATFDFAVEADGLYPVSCIWEETGGGAALHLWSTNFVTGDPEVLINDPGNPAGVVKAWYPLVCKSSSSVAGPYTVDSTAVNVLNPTTDIVGSDCAPTVVGSMVTGGTFTIPVSSSPKFYRLDGSRATKITNISKGVSDVVITYQVQ